METSLSAFKTKVSTTNKEKQRRDPSGSKQVKGGAYAPDEYGNAMLYGFPPQYSKRMNASAAHTRTVNYEIRDPALRVGGG